MKSRKNTLDHPSHKSTITPHDNSYYGIDKIFKIPDLLVEIFTYLSPSLLLEVSLVCKTFLKVINKKKRLWLERLENSAQYFENESIYSENWKLHFFHVQKMIEKWKNNSYFISFNQPNQMKKLRGHTSPVNFFVIK